MRNLLVHLFFNLFCFSLVSGQNPLAAGDHFASVNGIKLHYFVSGSGPVCLFPSPGWGPSVEFYQKSLMPMGKFFTMVYYDTRLSGRSTGPEDSTKYTIKDFATDMDSLRIYLNQPKVWVMGHSAGGYQALYYGMHYPNRLNGVIAIDAFVGRDSLYGAAFTKNMMKRKDQPFFARGAALFTGKDTTHYSLRDQMMIIIPFYFHDTTKIERLVSFIDINDPSAFSDRAAKYTSISGFNSEVLFPDLGKIKVPVLVIVGDDDFICDKITQADRAAERIPSATELIIKNAGHFPWIEEPQQFFSQSAAWLTSQKLGTRN
jgi:proline iminopeptidase